MTRVVRQNYRGTDVNNVNVNVNNVILRLKNCNNKVQDTMTDTIQNNTTYFLVYDDHDDDDDVNILVGNVHTMEKSTEALVYSGKGNGVEVKVD